MLLHSIRRKKQEHKFDVNVGADENEKTEEGKMARLLSIISVTEEEIKNTQKIKTTAKPSLSKIYKFSHSPFTLLSHSS